MLTTTKKLFNSLKVRVITSAMLMGIILLPAVGFVISTAYEKHMMTGIKNELKAYSYAILAVADVEDKNLSLPASLIENQFNIDESGLYAFFSSHQSKDLPLWRSGSLFSIETPQELIFPKMGNSAFYETDLNAQSHFMYSFTVSFETADYSQELTLHIAKERQEIQQLLSKFQQQLWVTLLILMIILVSVQLVWLMWSLQPLSYLKRELLNIEQGKAKELTHEYPKELKQVTQQLNALLQAEQNQRKRYRNALSDLAHSLKTPLAVMQSQGELTDVMNEQISHMNKMIEHQLKKAQSAGYASWHVGIDIGACIDKLQSSLTKIYHDKALVFSIDIEPELTFKGDEADLYEMLGNVLDNAAKAAIKYIHINVSFCNKHQQLECSIEDDGVGVDEVVKNDILQRGVRADTYSQGHGIGLAIVRDLVESYQGILQINQSKTLNGAKFVLIFPHKNN